MDPTDIVKVPYDKRRLTLYVLGVILLALVSVARTAAPTKSLLLRMRQWLTDVLILSVFCWAVLILCGTSPEKNIQQTILASLHFTTMIWFHPPVFHSGQQQQPSTLTGRVHLCVRATRVTMEGEQKQPRQQDMLSSIQAYGTVFTVIPCQILLLYDHGMQAQRWPVPLVSGATYGWAIGTLFGTIWCSFRYGFAGVSSSSEVHHHSRKE